MPAATKKQKAVKVAINSREVLPRFTDDELTWLAERVGLTLAELKRLHQAAHATYQAIGAVEQVQIGARLRGGGGGLSISQLRVAGQGLATVPFRSGPSVRAVLKAAQTGKGGVPYQHIGGRAGRTLGLLRKA